MKAMQCIVVTAALVLLVSGSALAAEGKPGPRSGKADAPQLAELSPEQQAQAKELFKAHRDKVMPLRDKLDGRRMELRAYRDIAGITKEDVRALVDEIVSLRGQIRAERTAYFEAMDKAGLGAMCPAGMMRQNCPFADADDECPGMSGQGRGMMMGPGGMMGPGKGREPGKGMGPGKGMEPGKGRGRDMEPGRGRGRDMM